jgi:hypothetical protein
VRAFHRGPERGRVADRADEYQVPACDWPERQGDRHRAGSANVDTATPRRGPINRSSKGQAQIGALLALVRSLQRKYGISSSNIIGHAMANQAPQFRDLEGWRNDHTDWQTKDVLEVRRRLAATR